MTTSISVDILSIQEFSRDMCLEGVHYV